MEFFQVIEDKEGIEEAILRALPSGWRREKRVSERHPALLVVSPRAATRGFPLPRQCRTALLPGGMGVCRLRRPARSAMGCPPGTA